MKRLDSVPQQPTLRASFYDKQLAEFVLSIKKHKSITIDTLVRVRF